MPRPGQVLGLVGTNGIGKSTALKILAGKMKPNLGRHELPPDWEEILVHFRGSELQNYFTKILEDRMDGKGRYLDNIFIERLWRSIKYELIYIKAFEDGKHLKKEVKDWLVFFFVVP
jgi:translation initiation factor RLI1